MTQSLQLDALHFILTFNRTTMSYKDQHSGNQGRIFNVSQTFASIHNLPTYTEFRIFVYLVDSEANLVKSHKISVRTDEGVPEYAPDLYDFNTNPDKGSISLKWWPIQEEDAGGVLLGYNITYYPVNEPHNSKENLTDANTTTVTLPNLSSGVTYVIFVAGFTSKGSGKRRKTFASVCGGTLTDERGSFFSPNLTYDSAKEHHDDSYHVECKWKITPEFNNSMIWLTFSYISLGYRSDDYCSGGVYLSFPVSMKRTNNETLEICGQRANFTLLIQGPIVNVSAEGFDQYIHKYDGVDARVEAHYKGTSKNLSEITGEVISSWMVNQSNISNTSFVLSWSAPPSSFLGGLFVEKYLVLNITNSTRIYHAKWLEPYETEVTFSGLLPWANYSVTVVAVLSGGNKRGHAGWMVIETEEGVPLRGPDVHWYYAVNYNTIFVKWLRLPKKRARGNLLAYRVYAKAEYPYYNETSVTRVGASQLEVNITQLRSSHYYYIWITAVTAIGEGTASYNVYVQTKCGWPVFNTIGYLQSPENDSRIVYSDCIWEIYPPSDSGSVILTFAHFDLPVSYKCSLAYVSVSNGNAIDPVRICGYRSPFTVLEQGPVVKVMYYSTTYADSSAGFQVHYLALNDSVLNAPVLAAWNITAVNENSSIIRVTWTPYQPSGGHAVYMYAVVCIPTEYDFDPIIGSTDSMQFELEVGGLKPYTQYEVQVVALMNMSGEEFIMQGSEKVVLITLEGVPSEPPPNVIALIKEDNVITVSWSPLPSESANGDLISYTVYYRVAFSEAEYEHVTVKPSVLEVDIVNLTSSAPYEVTVAGCTMTGCGVQSQAIYVHAGCGVPFLSSTTGVIKSPRYPKEYPSNASCVWFMRPVPVSPDHRMILLFNSFDTESTNASNCTSDAVGVLKVTPISTDFTAIICGRLEPFAVSLDLDINSSVAIGFVSDGRVEEQGFHANYFFLNVTSQTDITVASESITHNEARVIWQTAADVSDIEEYIVLYKTSDSSEFKWNVTRTNDTQELLRNLQQLTEYLVQVLAVTTSGEIYGTAIIQFQTTEAPDINTTASTPEQVSVLRMYPFGNAAGDKTVACDFFPYLCCKIDIPNGGMVIFGQRFQSIYICGNGVLQFKYFIINHWPYRFGLRSWLRELPMLAPYWSDVDLEKSFTSGISKVFYRMYTNSTPGFEEILRNATSNVYRFLPSPLPTEFEASWLLVVTWENLRPSNLNGATVNLTNTFQAVIATDGVYSFVTFNYPENGIQWSAPATVLNYEFYTESRGLPVIGWNAGDRDEHLFNYKRSGSVQTEQIDNVLGNTNLTGKWFFRLENSSGEQDGELKCRRWFENQPDPSNYTDNLEPCPCSIWQALRDWRFRWIPSVSLETYCVYTQFPSVAGRGRRCCYYGWGASTESFGALIVGQGGGTVDQYHQLFFNEFHEANDVQGYQYCCVQSRMCQRFYKKRPSEGCDTYSPPAWSWFWGDPHFVTLDGQNYTFNGLGEFIMVDVKDSFFQLQARTKLAKGRGTATVFAEAVAKEQNTSTIQVGLNDNGGLRVLVDGQIYDGIANLTNTSVTLNGSVAVSRPANDSFLATFPSGISVTFSDVIGSLSIVFAAPVSFKNTTKGLLGTWNDNPLDDFLRPDSTTLPPNATGRQIHFDFGLLWNVTSATSLFTYNRGENTSTFSNYSFVPIFLDELQFESDELQAQAENVCKGDINCLFDVASTKDLSVGESTLQVSVELENENEQLQNFPPSILVGLLELNLTVNTSASVTVTAEDPNGDTMTFSVIGNLPSDAVVSSNDSSVTISWEVTTEQIDLEFVVSDSKGATSVLRPPINVCACHNQGTCVANENVEMFNILSCVCDNGYTGSFCEADLDACVANFQPCYPGVGCVDLPPPANSSGFQCGPCPSGFTGNGMDCLDLDECSPNNGGCSQQCFNSPGSFVCACDSGYELSNEDQKTCNDIDECSPVSDCAQTCENFPGGYNCSCNEDFKVDPSNPKNCQPKNPCVHNQLECKHFCYSSGDQEKCGCNASYALDEDRKSCTDIDECEPNKNRCNQNCHNLIGGYYCSCDSGFRLIEDNFTCNDINECFEGTFNCPDDSMLCQNTHGHYNCICEEGLEMIDNKCQEPVSRTTPQSTTVTTIPPTASEEEKLQAVEIKMSGFNISQWNETIKESLKTSVANAATQYCEETGECTAPNSSRRKRATSNIVFTQDQVHILPGYPRQLSLNPLIASIAFYLQFPPEVSQGVISKDVLVSIVKSSIADISQATSLNISSVEALIEQDSSSTPSTTSPGPTDKKDSNNTAYIIAGCVAGGIVLIIIVLVVIACYKKPQSCVHPKGADISQPGKDVEMHNVRGNENQAYYIEHGRREGTMGSQPRVGDAFDNSVYYLPPGK